MTDNPYKYKGALNLTHVDSPDWNVCISRQNEVDQVKLGIERGDYWTILGPKQSGKTTFLSLIKKTFVDDAYCIYINFQTPPDGEENLYQMVIDRIQEEIPHKKTKDFPGTSGRYGPGLRFINYLETFLPQEDKKIILLLDEVDGLPVLDAFLHTWRSVFHKRQSDDNLARYAVVTTGSTSLIKLSMGTNSPFNIAEKLYLKDFSPKDSEHLITNPLKELQLQIEPEALKKLLSLLSGHPQILQHAGHILVERSKTTQKKISKVDVNETIKELHKYNSCLSTLMNDIKTNAGLKHLAKKILKRKEIKFDPNREFSLLGAGMITEKDTICTFRNDLFKQFVKDILKYTPGHDQSKNLLHDIGNILAVLSLIAPFIIAMVTEGTPKIIKIITGILALIAIALFIIYYFSKGKETGTNSEDA